MFLRNIFLLLSILTCSFAKSQSYNRSYEEFGIMAGPVFFQGDFGERRDLDNTIQNVGFSGSFVYYLSLNSNRSVFAENFKVRFDLSALAVDLQHYGPSAESDSDFGRKLRAMRGSVKIGSIGAQLEYFPWKVDDWSRTLISPYIGAGIQLNSYSAKAYSFLGPIGVPSTVPTKYVEGFKNTSGVAFSASISGGLRYKLNDYNAIIFESRLHYYFSDWIEGMNPDRNTYKENKNNDFALVMNIGYVYYFN